MMKKIVAVSAVVASTTTASMAPAEQIGENWLIDELGQCYQYAAVANNLNQQGVENTLYDNFIDKFLAEVAKTGGPLTNEELIYLSIGIDSFNEEVASPDFDLEAFFRLAITEVQDCNDFLDAFIVIVKHRASKSRW